MRAATQTVHRLLEDVLVGRPAWSGALVVVPLFGTNEGPAGEYLLAEEAFRQGILEIGEVDDGRVPELVAQNRADLPVVLIQGEHLVGAKQNRILNATAILAPRSRTVLPVACVEQGRWHVDGPAGFAPAPEMAYTRVRATAHATVIADMRATGMRRAGQGEVWADVGLKERELGVRARDGAMRDAYAQRGGGIEEIVAGLNEPRRGQTGCVAMVGRHAKVVDLFDREETFRALWPRLARGYAMDALGVQPERPDTGRALRVLSRARRAEATEHAGIGLGTDVVMASDRLTGGALVWNDSVVHLALFPRPAAAVGREEGAAPHVERRASYFHRETP